MRIITRYILREHLGPFLFSLLTIVFVFILNIVFRDLGRLLGKGIPLGTIFEFFFLNLAWIVALAVPMAVLVATLMAFGRLSQDHEITALRASGIDLVWLMRPVFVAALILAAVMARFNDTLLPEFNHRVRQLYADISQKKPTLALEPNVFFNEIEHYSLLVNKIEKDRLEGILLTDTSDPRYNRTVIAKHGTFRYNEAEGRLILDLREGEIHEVEQAHLDKYRRSQFTRQVFSISAANLMFIRGQSQQRGDREKTVAMMKKDIQGYQKSLAKKERELRSRVKMDLFQVFPFISSESDSNGVPSSLRTTPRRLSEARKSVQNLVYQIKGEKGTIKAYRMRINASRVEIHKKYSIPTACLVFVLIGAPLGIMARHGGLAMGAGLSTIFFLIYWAFLIGGEQLGDRGHVDPAVAMWAPNLLVGSLGVYLVIRTLKEATFIPWERWSTSLKHFFQRLTRCS